MPVEFGTFCGSNECFSWRMCLLVCLCACKHFGFCACLWFPSIIMEVISQTSTKIGSVYPITFKENLSCLTNPVSPFFSKQETCMAIITPVSVLLSLTCMLIVFWTKNDKKKWHNIFASGVCRAGSTHVEEQCACLSFIFQCYSSATAVREKTSTIYFWQGGWRSLEGGREQPQGFFFFFF